MCLRVLSIQASATRNLICASLCVPRMLAETAPGLVSALAIEVKGHDKTISRYGENKRTCHCSIFSMCVVHYFSPDHSGGDQFFCQCYWGDFFCFDNIDRKPAHQNQTSKEQNRRPKQSGACSGYRSCRTPDDSPKRHSPLRDHNDRRVQASSRPSRDRALRRHPEFGS